MLLRPNHDPTLQNPIRLGPLPPAYDSRYHGTGPNTHPVFGQAIWEPLLSPYVHTNTLNIDAL